MKSVLQNIKRQKEGAFFLHLCAIPKAALHSLTLLAVLLGADPEHPSVTGPEFVRNCQNPQLSVWVTLLL